MSDRDYETLLTLLRKEARGTMTRHDVGRLRSYISRWDMAAYRYPEEEVVRLARLAAGMEYFLRLAEKDARRRAS